MKIASKRIRNTKPNKLSLQQTNISPITDIDPQENMESVNQNKISKKQLESNSQKVEGSLNPSHQTTINTSEIIEATKKVLLDNKENVKQFIDKNDEITTELSLF